jgi:S1-C subfamily serine protease
VLLGLATVVAGCAPNGPPSAVVGIVVSDSCGPGIETGSGALVAPGLVLTAAHVLAGAETFDVIRDGRSVPGRIVGFDPEMDLAYVAVDGLQGVPFQVSSEDVEAGDRGVAYVVRESAVVALPVTVVRRVSISTEDVYAEGETLRPGFELAAEIRTGDSGAAVVIGGELAGVVWARSRQSDARGWAIDPDRAGALIREQLRTGRLGPDIDLTRCR